MSADKLICKAEQSNKYMGRNKVVTEVCECEYIGICWDILIEEDLVKCLAPLMNDWTKSLKPTT